MAHPAEPELRRGPLSSDGELWRLRAELTLRERQVDGLAAAAERARAEWASHALADDEREREAEAQLSAQRDAARASAERVAALERREAERQRELRGREHELRERERELDAARRRADELAEQVAQRDAALGELQIALARLSAQREDAERRAQAEGAALRDVLSSHSWRLTKGLRIVSRALRPDGTDGT